MNIVRSIDVAASPQAVWSIVANIRGAADVVGGIDSIEVLEEATGPSLSGFKWKETRTLMGREATEVMWIVDSAEPHFYESRAESHGSVYQSRVELQEIDGGVRLVMSFNGEAITLTARILWLLTGWIARRSVIKVIDQDLRDLKLAVEERSTTS